MIIQHPQEIIIKTFDHNGISVDIVKWTDTIWCGKIGYAVNNTDEPDVEIIMNSFSDFGCINERENDWDVCMSINYLSSERPNGVMVGFLVQTEQQPDNFNIYKVPAAQYMRIPISDETAKALSQKMWDGGMPPYKWIGEQIAPKSGYKYGDDTLPIFEYYGYYNYDKNEHKFRYLYVPIEKA